MIERPRLLHAVRAALKRSPVTALLGPRQCGKTTLAREVAGRSAVIFDLEDPNVRLAFENPKTLLQDLGGLVVIDEVQRTPDLFPVLRVLVDRPRNKVKFLVLGSASPDLLRQSSETLAGRVAFVEMGGFDLFEVPRFETRLWWRGGFPRSFLARSDADSRAWRNDFAQTFLERDIPQLGMNIPALTLRRFWTMVAHYHGQTWNSSEVAGSLGVDDTTARRYLDLLAGAYMVRLLPPWFENVGKRQRKTPKVYVRDTGILHTLLGIDSTRALLAHPKAGASWEGLAIEQVLRTTSSRDFYHWGVHEGAELDLLVVHGGRKYGFEMKRSDAPKLTKGMLVARDTLKLRRLWVVYPGSLEIRLERDIIAIPLSRIDDSIRS